MLLTRCRPGQGQTTWADRLFRRPGDGIADGARSRRVAGTEFRRGISERRSALHPMLAWRRKPAHVNGDTFVTDHLRISTAVKPACLGTDSVSLRPERQNPIRQTLAFGHRPWRLTALTGSTVQPFCTGGNTASSGQPLPIAVYAGFGQLSTPGCGDSPGVRITPNNRGQDDPADGTSALDEQQRSAERPPLAQSRH